MTLFIAMLALAGCNTNKEEPKKEQKLEAVKVAVQTNPKEIKPGEKTEVQALVTQGKEKVTDADDVKFEIWKAGDEKHEMLEGKHKGKGVYAVEKTFETDGVYHIIAHTNARRNACYARSKSGCRKCEGRRCEKKKIVIMVQDMAIIKAIQ